MRQIASNLLMSGKNIIKGDRKEYYYIMRQRSKSVNFSCLNNIISLLLENNKGKCKEYRYIFMLIYLIKY